MSVDAAECKPIILGLTFLNHNTGTDRKDVTVTIMVTIVYDIIHVFGMQIQ